MAMTIEQSTAADRREHRHSYHSIASNPHDNCMLFCKARVYMYCGDCNYSGEWFTQSIVEAAAHSQMGYLPACIGS